MILKQVNFWCMQIVQMDLDKNCKLYQLLYSFVDCVTCVTVQNWLPSMWSKYALIKVLSIAKSKTVWPANAAAFTSENFSCISVATYFCEHLPISLKKKLNVIVSLTAVEAVWERKLFVIFQPLKQIPHQQLKISMLIFHEIDLK